MLVAGVQVWLMMILLPLAALAVVVAFIISLVSN